MATEPEDAFAWSARMRAKLRALVLESPVRRVAGPVHTVLTAAELRLARALDPLARRSRLPAGCLTAIIKTFERPALVERLVRSLRRHYPEVPVVIADDSRIPSAIPGVETVVLPFDSGVSAGRAAALARVRTPYVWNLDDDFVIFFGTDAAIAVEALERHAALDLIGGVVIDLPHLRRRRADPGAIFEVERAPRLPLGTILGDCEVRDKVSNFFVARTESLRKVGYTPELKRLDHADFFSRARGILASAHCERLVCLHAQTPFDRHYQRYRQAFDADFAELTRRYPSG